MKHALNGIVMIAICFVSGCTQHPMSTSHKTDPSVRKRLLTIAGEYKTYQLADNHVKWAPELCGAPALPPISWNPGPTLRFSESESTSTHGRKLYFLHARDSKAYLKVATQASPVGQVLVKEAFAPVEFKPDAKDFPDAIQNSRLKLVMPTYKPFDIAQIQPIAWRDGKTYRAGPRTGLFIMYKAGPEIPAASTDQGWLYGTVSADGKTVTSAGRVASCMKCHADAPRDRLFGLAKSGF